MATNTKVVKKLNKKKLSIAIIGFVIVILLVLVFILGLSLGPANKDGKSKKFTVKEGTPAYSVVDDLYNAGLIKNATSFKIYMKIRGSLDFQAGSYFVDPTQNSIEIYKNFKNNKFSVPDAEMITFKEGLNMKGIAKVISEHSNLSQKEVLTKANDKTYINTLMKSYWFITKDVTNKNIYYSLEGYLFPDTYSINKNATVEDIFKMMLDKELEVLNKHKTEIEASKYSIHELLTLASVVELEGNSSEDRAKIAGVFYNRLAANMDLGSDITTYYAVGKEVGVDELTNSDLVTTNPYNTRATGMMGKLPVGPICNVGSDSITAVLKPTKSKNYYFVSDKNGKIYYTKTIDEHNTLVSKLKREGNW